MGFKQEELLRFTINQRRRTDKWIMILYIESHHTVRFSYMLGPRIEDLTDIKIKLNVSGVLDLYLVVWPIFSNLKLI